MKESYEKISPTAKFVAYMRTFTDIPCAKEIAEESGSEKVFQELTDESAKSTVRLAPYWEARYKATNHILVEYGITQILEIAAGLSPRGLAMTRDPKIIYVVTDLPQILDVERTIAETILARSNSHRPNLYFRAVNAMDMESLSTAAAAFKYDKPIAIITEGLLPYFNRSEKGTLAGNIHELLGKYDGIWITSDVHTRQYVQEFSHVYDDTRQRLTRISTSSETNLESNLFADENDIKQFFGEAGFRMREYSYSDVLGDLSSIKLLTLSQDEIQKIRWALKIAKTLILTPKKQS